jgi:hypothetical protein
LLREHASYEGTTTLLLMTRCKSALNIAAAPAGVVEHVVPEIATRLGDREHRHANIAHGTSRAD